MFTHTHIHTHTHTRVSARVSVSCAKTQIGKESMREPLSIAAFTRSMKLTYLQTHASVSICPTQVYSCTRNIHENPSAGCALPVHADLLPHTSPSLFNNVYPSQIHRCTRKVHETLSVCCALPVHTSGVWSWLRQKIMQPKIAASSLQPRTKLVRLPCTRQLLGTRKHLQLWFFMICYVAMTLFTGQGGQTLIRSIRN